MHPSMWTWLTSTSACAPCCAAMAQRMRMACRTAGPQPPSSMPRSASVSSSLSASRGAMGIVTSSAATELSLISRDFARARTSNTVGVARKTGSGLPNISAATDAPRVRTSSASENTSAAGARPFNAISSKTPEPEQEPRLVGIIKMLPPSETPCSGWWTSMTRLVAGSRLRSLHATKSLGGTVSKPTSDWSLTPVVRALQALRGLALVAPATLVAELGDITRFANPRQFMAYLGLVPSEHSSGSTRRQGGITKAGNGAARRLLLEAAWSYRFPARISREQLLRQEALAKPIRDTAWKAQERLCRRYRRLARAGKSPTVVTTAIARELAGFAWAIAKHVQAAAA